MGRHCSAGGAHREGTGKSENKRDRGVRGMHHRPGRIASGNGDNRGASGRGFVGLEIQANGDRAVVFEGDLHARTEDAALGGDSQ